MKKSELKKIIEESIREVKIHEEMTMGNGEGKCFKNMRIDGNRWSATYCSKGCPDKPCKSSCDCYGNERSVSPNIDMQKIKEDIVGGPIAGYCVHDENYTVNYITKKVSGEVCKPCTSENTACPPDCTCVWKLPRR